MVGRSQAGRALALAALGCLPGGCARAGAAGPPRGPNVLVVCIDTLRADRLGLYGSSRGTSPRLDALGAQGVVFEDVLSATSWTLPSITSVLTSYYSSTHRVWNYADVLHPSYDTLPEVLLAAGWDTAGVTSHDFFSTTYGTAQGFVHFDDTIIRTDVDATRRISSGEVSDRAVRWIETKGAVKDDRPWLLWLHYFDPHYAYLPHPGISERFGTVEEVDLYDGEIAWTDQQVGRVLEALDRTGASDDTIVVVFADHGEGLGDHGRLRHGGSLFHEVVRVPLVIRAPGLAPRRVPGTVRTVDLFPTVLELAGLPPRAGLEGRSLVPLMRGGVLPELPALSELANVIEEPLYALREGRWMLVTMKDVGQQLFDREADPGELVDLAGERPEVAEEMQARLREIVAAARRKAEPYGSFGERTLLDRELEDLQALGYAGNEER